MSVYSLPGLRQGQRHVWKDYEEVAEYRELYAKHKETISRASASRITSPYDREEKTQPKLDFFTNRGRPVFRPSSVV